MLYKILFVDEKEMADAQKKILSLPSSNKLEYEALTTENLEDIFPALQFNPDIKLIYVNEDYVEEEDEYGYDILDSAKKHHPELKIYVLTFTETQYQYHMEETLHSLGLNCLRRPLRIQSFMEATEDILLDQVKPFDKYQPGENTLDIS